MTAGVIYYPPSQTNVLETMNVHFTKLHFINIETHILGNFKINLYLIKVLCYLQSEKV